MSHPWARIGKLLEQTETGGDGFEAPWLAVHAADVLYVVGKNERLGEALQRAGSPARLWAGKASSHSRSFPFPIIERERNDPPSTKPAAEREATMPGIDFGAMEKLLPAGQSGVGRA